MPSSRLIPITYYNASKEIRISAYADIIVIAKGYSIPGRSISRTSELKAAINEMLKASGPFLLNCLIDRDDEAMPMIPPGRHCDETMF